MQSSTQSRIIIAGGTGLIGTALGNILEQDDREVVALTRSHPAEGQVLWNGSSPGEWTECIEGAAAVVNLCGKNINCRPTGANRQKLIDSRVKPTLTLLEAVKNCKEPPEVFIQASAVGYYGDTVSECTEKTPRGKGFLPDICMEWEKAFNSIDLPEPFGLC